MCSCTMGAWIKSTYTLLCRRHSVCHVDGPVTGNDHDKNHEFGTRASLWTYTGTVQWADMHTLQNHNHTDDTQTLDWKLHRIWGPDMVETSPYSSRHTHRMMIQLIISSAVHNFKSFITLHVFLWMWWCGVSSRSAWCPLQSSTVQSGPF